MINIGFGIAAAIGGIASTLIGNHSAKKEARRNREFQEEMSNTSISRRMQDLRNAGLNPLLAVDSASAGASTPSGSQAQIERFDPSWITAMSSAKLQKQQGEVAKAEERKVNAEAEAVENDNSIFEFKAKKAQLEAEREAQGIETEKLIQELHKQKTQEARVETYKKVLESKGIHLNNKQIETELKWLMFDIDNRLDVFKSNPTLKEGLALTGVGVKDLDDALMFMASHLGLNSAGEIQKLKETIQRLQAEKANHYNNKGNRPRSTIRR